MSIEAMKQALEVIEAAIKAGDWKVDGACDPDMAIHNLRQAIEQAEKQKPVALKVVKGEICYKSNFDDQSYGMWCPVCSDSEHGFSEGTTFYTTPQPKREPLTGVIEVKKIGYHSLQLIFESQDAIKKFKATHGIKGEA
jgi:hypothetical protein